MSRCVWALLGRCGRGCTVPRHPSHPIPAANLQSFDPDPSASQATRVIGSRLFGGEWTREPALACLGSTDMDGVTRCL